jgi:hypothetical protein
LAAPVTAACKALDGDVSWNTGSGTAPAEGAREDSMRTFDCARCGVAVYFENTHCENCRALLAFEPATDRMASFDPAHAGDPEWLGVGADEGRRLRPCANRVDHDACNWMLDESDDEAVTLCRCCRLNAMIPALDVEGNLDKWRTIETAKRRLMYTLLDLGLMPQPRRADEEGDRGLEFRFLASPEGGPRVLTGHADGVITLDIAEADDAYRELTRVQFGEPMRTLLGHLRHEASHYLHWRWIDGTPLVDDYRAVFGDENADYAAALAKYHAEKAPPDWGTRYISAYASAHPHEDWAETCAHVLLAIDAVQTAAAWGLRLDGPAASTEPTEPTATEPMPRLLWNDWLPVARFVNAMNRSLGHRDAYPFVFSDAVVEKMSTVQRLLKEARERA